jgi:hypothetical protein
MLLVCECPQTYATSPRIPTIIQYCSVPRDLGRNTVGFILVEFDSEAKQLWYISGYFSFEFLSPTPSETLTSIMLFRALLLAFSASAVLSVPIHNQGLIKRGLLDGFVSAQDPFEQLSDVFTTLGS